MRPRLAIERCGMVDRLRWALARLVQPRLREVENELATMRDLVEIITDGRTRSTAYSFDVYERWIERLRTSAWNDGLEQGQQVRRQRVAQK